MKKSPKKSSLKGALKLLSAIFAIAATGTIGAITGIRAVADKESAVLESIGMTQQELKQIYSYPLIVTYYEDPWAERAAATNLDYGYVERLRNSRNAIEKLGRYDIYLGMQGGNFWANAIDSQKFPYINLLSDYIFPSIVTLPERTLSKDELIKIFTGIDAKALRAQGLNIDLPGSAANYRKIIFLHEIEHSHHSHAHSANYREYSSDGKAIEQFLELGGDPEVAQAYIKVLRAMDSLRLSFYLQYLGTEPMEMSYFNSLNLYAQNNESSTLTFQEERDASIELGKTLVQLSTQNYLNDLSYHQGDAHSLYTLCLASTIDSSIALSKNAADLRDMYIEGYDLLLQRSEDMRNQNIAQIKMKHDTMSTSIAFTAPSPPTL